MYTSPVAGSTATPAVLPGYPGFTCASTPAEIGVHWPFSAAIASDEIPTPSTTTSNRQLRFFVSMCASELLDVNRPRRVPSRIVLFQPLLHSRLGQLGRRGRCIAEPHRGAIGQHLGRLGGKLGRVVPHADHCVRAQLLGVRDH